MSIVCVFIGCVTFLYIGRLILTEVSKYQAEPYMDEIFHIAQAQRYCAGRYSEVKNTDSRDDKTDRLATKTVPLLAFY